MQNGAKCRVLKVLPETAETHEQTVFQEAEQLTYKDRAHVQIILGSREQSVSGDSKKMFSEEKANDLWRRKKGELSKKS